MSLLAVSPTKTFGRSDRIVGVDTARAVAILGMIAVHLGPTNVEGVAGRLYAVPYGRASLLFVLVSGIAITLTTRNKAFGTTAAGLLWRAVLLLPAGLLLQHLDHGANVILQSYAALFVIATLAVRMPGFVLLAGAAAAAIAGPVAILGWHAARQIPREHLAVGFDVSWPELLTNLALEGPYPLVTWIAPLLLGMWIGRQPLRATGFQQRLIVIGGGVAVVAYVASRTAVAMLGEPIGDTDARHLVTAIPHDQMPLWLIGGIAAAVVVVGLSLYFVAVPNPMTQPLIATGQLALTIYVGHLLILHLAKDALATDELSRAVPMVAMVMIVIVATSTLWVHRLGQGPLERIAGALPRRRHPQPH